ncbi:peptidase S15 [Bradyrhizobium sp. Leo170]|nr:peptidase S15 [Bradyrhizobium sp. Leo170]
MIYDQNVAVTLRDGHVVYANVFRPKQAGTYPVIMAQGPYGKDATFQEAYASGWTQLLKANPNICAQSSCRFMRWEHTDPERWVGGGYVVIALDVRGAGYSPGYLDLVSAREARDFYDAIEWAAAQPWSNGKVGLLGISYMAINQWQVAALQSPHLAAIIPWEGASDLYREALFHGGIESNVFLQLWFKSQILPNQNGNAATAYKDPGTGRPPTGAALSDDLLKANRRNLIDSAHAHPLLDGYNQEINADLSRIRTPLLSAGNLSAPSLHGRGNYEGFVQASSTEKWLFLHTGTHDDSFYSDEGIALQHKFFDHYLKGIDNKWEKTARVSLVERDPARATWTTRSEEGWPLARTRYVNYHLDAQNRSLGTEVPKGEASVTFDAGKTAATFDMVFDRTMEFTGPLAAHLWVASSTADADLFVTLQLFDEKGREVTFLGASDTASPLAQGWLRASRRKLDVQRSKPYQPWHTHDEVQKLKPDEFYPVDVEIWPTSIVVHPGYKLTLRIEGADFQRPPSNPDGKSIGRRGSGVFLHDDPADRPNPEFSGVTTIASGGARDSFLVLPTIPRGE